MLPITIDEAASRLRDGSLTCEALTQELLGRIARLDPILHAFITVNAGPALETAVALDRELRSGKDRGPLHGIPIVHKDLYDTAGLRTTIGSRFHANRVPEEDSTVVSRLRAAGTVLLGKTNLSEFAADTSGKNVFYGDVPNPWDLSRAAGGSSSGTAAAVAAGLCLAGTGSDTGGSIRIPCAWCALVGLRPTFGLVSLYGVFPRAYTLDCGGPIARTARDAALLLNAMAGHDSRYEYSLRGQQVDYTVDLDRGVKGLRLGIIENYTFRGVDAEVAAAVQSAADTLARLGAKVKTVRIPLLEGPLDYTLLFNIVLYEFHQVLGEAFRAHPSAADVFGPVVRSNLALGKAISRESYEQALAQRPRLAAEARQVFAEVDALLTPVTAMAAPTLSAPPEHYDRGRQFTLPISFLGLPAITVPCGFTEGGLPVGLQIIGNDCQEASLLRIASAYERETQFYTRRPSLRCRGQEGGA